MPGGLPVSLNNEDKRRIRDAVRAAFPGRPPLPEGWAAWLTTFVPAFLTGRSGPDGPTAEEVATAVAAEAWRPHDADIPPDPVLDRLRAAAGFPTPDERGDINLQAPEV